MSADPEASTSSSNTAAYGSENNSVINLVDNLNKEDVCKIAILNDDCLTHIFTFLSHRQRIMIERVCKRWRDVAVSSWSIVKKISTLDIVLGPHAVQEMAYYLQHTLKCCTALRYLDVKYVYPLEEVFVSGNLMQLEELILDGCRVTDDGLENVFDICPNVTTLKISFIDEPITGESLPLTLQKLTLETGRWSKECMDYFIHNLKRIRDLKSLSLRTDLFKEVTSRQFKKILRSWPSQENLSFTNCKRDISNNRTKTIGISKNLVSLDLHDNSLVNDTLVKEISENCVNLESLDISGWCNVTDVGIQTLVNLPNLKCLSVGQLRKSSYVDDYVTDYELELLASRGKLEKLQISYNKKVTDEGCAKILSLCKEMEYLNLRGCRSITYKTVLSAETAAIRRTNNKKLEVVLAGTRVSPNQLAWIYLTPALTLNFEFDWKQC